MKYAIRFDNDPYWVSNDKELLFDTEDEAIQALNEEIVLCEEAIAEGFMPEFDFDDFTIVEVKK